MKVLTLEDALKKIDEQAQIIDKQNKQLEKYKLMLSYFEYCIKELSDLHYPIFPQMIREGDWDPDFLNRANIAEYGMRNIFGKTFALDEIFFPEECTSNFACYDLDQFFAELVNQINGSLGHKINGEVRFVKKNMENTSAAFNARKFCMIIYNLVANSMLHGKTDNKNIDIICKSNDKSFEISVRDHGGGLGDVDMENLFTFNEKDFNFKDQRMGAFPPQKRGMGLPICAKLASSMDGKFSIRNFRNGVQATFIIPIQSSGAKQIVAFVPDNTLFMHFMAPVFRNILLREDN